VKAVIGFAPGSACSATARCPAATPSGSRPNTPSAAQAGAHLRGARDENPAGESPELRAELRLNAGPAAITRFALERHDRLASDALDLFVDCYGTVAGDHALAVLPYGGVFVVGGVAAKILPRLEAGGFVRALTDKGAFGALAKSFPIAGDEQRLGLIGNADRVRLASALIPAQLRAPDLGGSR
jgi:hypothetical protein